MVVFAGLTVIEEVVAPPGDQDQLPPPEAEVAVSVACCPAQIIADVTETSGNAFTVTVPEFVAEQLFVIE